MQGTDPESDAILNNRCVAQGGLICQFEASNPSVHDNLNSNSSQVV